MLASALDAPRHYTLEAQLDDAQAEIRRLQALLDQARQQPAPYVSQKQAALILAVHPSRISRWVAQGAFQMIHVEGMKRPQIRRDSLHKPAPGKPGRKKKGT